MTDSRNHGSSIFSRNFVHFLDSSFRVIREEEKVAKDIEAIQPSTQFPPENLTIRSIIVTHTYDYLNCRLQYLKDLNDAHSPRWFKDWSIQYNRLA